VFSNASLLFSWARTLSDIGAQRVSIARNIHDARKVGRPIGVTFIKAR
jgi:hypothetical protein